MNTNPPFRDLTSYYAEKFDAKIQKIALNVGFSCPNRDGSKGWGGCTYCNNASFSPTYVDKSRSLMEQMERGIAFHDLKKGSRKYLAYFQSYTNTYSDPKTLKEMYDAVLELPNVVGLVVGTRPDCAPDEILQLLAEYARTYYVAIEFGVESTLNRTLESVNRCHSYEDSVRAITRANAYGLEVGAHLILGLPGESEEAMLGHASALSQLPVSFLKIHHLQIVKGTIMAHQYQKNPELFELFNFEYYLKFVARFLSELRPEIVIERVASTAPRELLIAPKWDGLRNSDIAQRLTHYMLREHLWQGKYWKG